MSEGGKCPDVLCKFNRSLKMESSLAKYLIANVFKCEVQNEWMDVGLKKNFLKEMFYKKDISMFESDLIEIIKRVPEELYYCVKFIVGNITCPPKILCIVAEENFAKIKNGKNFIFKYYGNYTFVVEGIALFDIIENANDELLEKIFFEIESMPLSCWRPKHKHMLLMYMVQRKKTTAPNILKRLLKMKDREISDLAEERLEQMGVHIEFKANELDHYESLDNGVLCKMLTYQEGYPRVEIKEMTPGAENILGTALNEETRKKEAILDLKTVFVKEEKNFSFFTITSSKKGFFVKKETHRHPLGSGPNYLSVSDINRKSTGISIWASGPSAGGSIEIV